MPEEILMTALPHDYYLKFVDNQVLQDTTDFHAKTNYTIHECVEHFSYLHRFPDETLRLLAGNELPLYPDMNLTLNGERIPNADSDLDIVRNESCDVFKEYDLPFATLKALLSPLMVRNDDSHKRGYPSAGALYPVESFVCALSSAEQDWPCDEKVLHILPQSRRFEIVQNTSDISALKRALLPPGSDIGSPSIAIIYMTYLPKVLFKYRFRGYRMANMEAGALYMLMDLSAKRVGIRNRVWSGYCDTMVSRSLGLSPALFHPLCVQFFGHTK
jgi:hypothetical protein